MDNLEFQGVGTHIQKLGSLFNTIHLHHKINHCNLPFQIFSGSPKSYKRKLVLEEEYMIIKNYIEKNEIRGFIHSIYLINLCRTREENERGLKCLETELINGGHCGFRGIVVHCGKKLKLPIDIALDIMYTNIKSVLKFASPECPLLLETPAGQGTEVCVTIENLLEFYGRFTEAERNVIKICIDTCHIFAAGHNPFEYIGNWLKEVNRESLVLVHFNDSKGEIGCCKDRHEYPGKGCIGKDVMMQTMQLCVEYKIPMVYE